MASRNSIAAPITIRVKALESALTRHGVMTHESVDDFVTQTAEQWVPRNGATVVARAWVDPEFRQRLLHNGLAAVTELGFPMPAHHKNLVVLENTPQVHNVICCTLCSCTAFTLIGVAPGWYKDLDYRARLVRQARTVLREMGLDLPESIEIRVWDTTTDTRYMVMPQRPAHTAGWPQSKLIDIITKESLIGVDRLA